MAFRYWVGGSGNWDASDTSHWSATSGGSAGASVPTSADGVIIDNLSDSGTAFTITHGAYTPVCSTISFTPDVVCTLSGSTFIEVRGSVWLTAAKVAFSGSLGFHCVADILYLSSNGVTIPNLKLSGTDATTDALIVSGYIELLSGNFTTGNVAVQAGSLKTSGSTVRTFVLGSSAITLTGATPIDFTSNANLSMSGSYTINIDPGAVTPTINAGMVLYNLVLKGSCSQYNITESVTVNSLSAARSGAYALNITAGKIFSATTWTLTGSAGNVVTLKSATPGVQASIAKAGGGTVTTTYMTVQDISASPALTWLSTNSTDGGGNTLWYFDAFYKPNTLLFGSPM